MPQANADAHAQSIEEKIADAGMAPRHQKLSQFDEAHERDQENHPGDISVRVAKSECQSCGEKYRKMLERVGDICPWPIRWGNE